MSNFTAKARLKGSNDEFEWVTMVDNYFGPREFGVRFIGSTTFYREDEVEFKDK